MIRNFWIKYVLLMRNPATPSGQTIGGIVCALITFRTQTSQFIINKQPRSLYHTESLDPSVAETLRLIRGGWCSQDRGGVGVSTLLIFSCLGAFQGKGGGGGGDFKVYGNGGANVQTKAVESFWGSGSGCNSLALTEKRG